MARGGMYDQLAGGFARYSTDAGWVVPHFEKMLYDNALLARVYAHLWRRTGSALARRVAAETCQWMLTRAAHPEGGLASALDADSDGAEGLFYTWTPAELAGALGAEDGEWAAEAFGVTGSGTFEHGRSVLQRRTDPSDADRLARVRGRAAGPARRSGSGRAGTTRWSRRGTGWPSPRWPRPGCCSGSRSSWPPRSGAAGLLDRVHLAGRAAGPDLAGRGGRAAAPGCWRTTPAWRRASWPCPG